ncbi:hypothetical protein BH09PSE5_BH09PSE5_38380 [soil metagenome]
MMAALFPRPDAYTEFVLEELENVSIGRLKGDKFLITGLQHHRRGKKIYAGWLNRTDGSHSFGAGGLARSRSLRSQS